MKKLFLKKGLFFLGLFFVFGACILSFDFVAQKLDSRYQISTADVRYKFLEARRIPTDPQILLKEKNRLSLSQEPQDMIYLAQLYVEEAKRTGQTNGYDIAENLALKALKLSTLE